MERKKHGAVGACICVGVIGFGLVTEVTEPAHAPHCPRYGRQVIVCGRPLDTVIPAHVHSTEVSTSVFSDNAVVAGSAGGAVHQLRLGEAMWLSDGGGLTVKPV